ncbi:glycosyltransferase [Methylosinus sp. Ce-a6]|uniref:glycosyltransferase n=1 Tax=Methylosinus sp. Ce-a6 TaxID=2172005 RepID=UPI00135AD0D2|nr:glycosyltransferase [Methylosinus sp. Ce-a6]
MIDSILFSLVVLSAVFWACSALLLLLSVTAALVHPWLVAKRGTSEERPPVSLVLPVKMLDQGFERAQESALAQRYPQFEALASATEADSPAISAMRDIFARHPEISTRILHSTARFAASPKVDNLFAPFNEARNDVIFMKDSNIVLEPDDLSETMRHLKPGVGMVCAIPYAARPENFAADVEAAIMNGPHQRMLFAASALGGGFGVGKIMLFRRGDFLRAGGFAAIAHTVGEDNATAKALKRIRLRTVFSHRLVRQELGERNLLDVYNRQLRWSVVRRDDEILSFLAEPFCQALPAFAAAAIGSSLVGVAPTAALTVTFCLWLSSETLLSIAKGWKVSWAAPAIFLSREALMFAVWLHAWTATKVVWARTTIDTRSSGEAAAATEPQVAKEEG